MAVVEQAIADDDAALVRAVQAGDTDAYAELFRRHYPAVRRACARRLNNMTEADEVAQAAFVRALERIDRCGGERRFGAWVHVIAQRLCIDVLRAQARTMPSEQPVRGDVELGPNAPEERVLDLDRASTLRAALSTLPPRQRDVVIARDVHDRRPPEIAAALGLSIGAVDSLLLRARRRLAGAYRAAAGEQGISTATSSTAVAGTTVAAGNDGLVGVVLNGVRAVRDAVLQLPSLVTTAPAGPGGARRVAAAAVAAAVSLGAGGGGRDVASPPDPVAVAPAVPVPTLAVPVPVPPPPNAPPAPAQPDVGGLVPAAPAVPSTPVLVAPVPLASPAPAPDAAIVEGMATTVDEVVTGLTTATGDAVAGATDALVRRLPVG